MPERFRKRRLPHWDIPGATYFVTTCLANSIPAQGLLDVEQYREKLESHRPANVNKQEWAARCWKLVFARADEWLDEQPAARQLEDSRLAEAVCQAMRHFAADRYDLFAYVVMPSHMHWLFRPRKAWAESLPQDRSPREVIMHSLKSFTAHQCNKLLNQSGKFWQDESYDHCVTDEDELARIVDYIELNPVKAGLCKRREEWRFSSAFDPG